MGLRDPLTSPASLNSIPCWHLLQVSTASIDTLASFTAFPILTSSGSPKHLLFQQHSIASSWQVSQYSPIDLLASHSSY
ncbi:hypothetical protein AVEN_112192-1 [Araneus ventricosus]|uniref:Uncharacterized protein n=1 Tax=Araneus ventricosus TaxID=182803 RepID=A0A4Y2G0P2_ARAVE|nr:hypothetical protein AVEN_112192-1 [Araneus ventricosus]